VLKVGFVINPRAGIGGPLGHKGSDNLLLPAGGDDRSRCAGRAMRTLAGLRSRSHQLDFYTAPGPMGENALRALGFACHPLTELVEAGLTGAADTREAARAFQHAGVDLILFAGGDGTARDICSVVGDRQVVLGIPAGVKMHSGVFAINPEAATAVLHLLLDGGLVDVREQPVKDIDEDALRRGEVRARLFGGMLVPEAGRFVQRVKDGGREVEVLVLDDIAAEVIELMEPDVLYLLAPGSTTYAIKEALGIAGTLLGVDAVLAGEGLGSDLDERAILALLERHPRAAIVVTPIGGQGILLGRGNQQLSPEVLRRVGRQGLVVVASKTKISGLGGQSLLLDTDDAVLDRELAGYIQVITGYRDRILYPLDAPGYSTGER